MDERDVLKHWGVKGMKWDKEKVEDEIDGAKKKAKKFSKSIMDKLDKSIVTPAEKKKIKANSDRKITSRDAGRNEALRDVQNRPKGGKTSSTHINTIKSPSDDSIKRVAKAQAEKYKRENSKINQIIKKVKQSVTGKGDGSMTVKPDFKRAKELRDRDKKLQEAVSKTSSKTVNGGKSKRSSGSKKDSKTSSTHINTIKSPSRAEIKTITTMVADKYKRENYTKGQLFMDKVKKKLKKNN